MDINKYQKIVGKSIERILHSYKDDVNNSYEFDNMGRVVSYRANSVEKSSHMQSEKSIVNNVNALCNELIKNFKDYSLEICEKTEIGYQMIFIDKVSNSINPNKIYVSIRNSGDISWIIVDYTDIINISQDDIDYFNEQLELYVNSNYNFKEYTAEVSYKNINDVLVANYTMCFTDLEGAYFTDLVTIVK